MPESPLKVLLFSGRFEVRGSSAYTLRLTERLGEHRVAPRVICPDSRSVDPEQRARLPITEYPYMLVPGWGRVVMALMRRDLAADPPDLIHVQSRKVLPQAAWLARKLQRPLILTVHDYLPSHERLAFETTWGRRIIAVSESVKAELVRRVNLSEELVTVIHAGVDVPEDLPTVPVLDPGHVPVVGTAGPLEAIKGFPYFLEAARKVIDERENVQFLVSGAGPQEALLRQQAVELGITGRITFVPNLLNFSVSLAAMDVFCLPSLQQGLGTIMLEAMGLGKPVIATGVGGVYSVLRDNENGLLVPPADSDELARRILELLDDPVRARALGEAGRRLVREEFNVEKMVERTVSLYRAVLAESEQTQPAIAGANSRRTDAG